MKKLLLFSFYFNLNLVADAQNDYQPIINHNANWSILETISNQSGVQKIETLGVYIDNEDTLINNKIYYSVSFQGQSLLTNYFSGTPKQIIGYISEDIQEKKVYFIQRDLSGNLQTETLLYDFSLEVGDTVEIHGVFTCEFENGIGNIYIVDSLGIIQLNDGISRKIWLLKAFDFSGGGIEQVTWVEGIGSLQGLVFPGCYEIISISVRYELLCFSLDNENIYRNPEYDSCYYSFSSATEIFTKNSEVSIYPNPVNDFLSIKLSQSHIIDNKKIIVSIFDLIGRQINVPINKTTSESWFVDVNSLKSGIYIIHINYGNSHNYQSVFIKK